MNLRYSFSGGGWWCDSLVKVIFSNDLCVPFFLDVVLEAVMVCIYRWPLVLLILC
jgi:hypothetical protein